MVLSTHEAERVLVAARKLIGKTYADIDCSNFVCEAYRGAGLAYDYANTTTFAATRAGAAGPFQAALGDPRAADVLLFAGHMGLWDPQGCAVLGSNAECKRLQGAAPMLSSRTGGNRGPDFGVPKWWGNFRLYRWAGHAPQGILALRIGQVIRPRLVLQPTKVANWKYARECAGIGGGLTEAARLTVVEIGTVPGSMWVRAQIPGSSPPRYLKISGEEFATNFQLG